jgi:solute carrier family 25 carnitine/acylcarnitine transporter 20/29
LLRDGIPHGVWFVSYEVAKDYLGSLLLVSTDKNGDVENDGGYHKSLTVPLLSGAFAATAAWGTFHPTCRPFVVPLLFEIV